MAHKSLYVIFFVCNLFQCQDAWLHEFGDPKKEDWLMCIFLSFCLGPLSGCFLFGDGTQLAGLWRAGQGLGAVSLSRLFG